MLNLFPGKIICPYCFESFSESKVMWRCDSFQCMQKDKLEEDEDFEKFHRGAQLKQPHILIDPKPRKGFAKCDKCGEMTRIRICKDCHSTLPDSEENIIISIVGAPGAGKSYFVGTLIRQLMNKMCRLNCSFSFTTRSDEKLYNTKFKEKFDNNEKLDKTQPPKDEKDFIAANTPLLCDIQDNKGIKRTFTFFDAAGENFDDKAMMNAVTKYLQHSAAILLILDPTQLAALSDESVPVSEEDGNSRISYEEILENIMEVVHKQQRLQSRKKIKIPIAVAFSKWDIIEKSLPPEIGDNLKVMQDSPYFRDGFSDTSCDVVSSEIEALLANWGCENFINKVKLNFETYKFFGFSAIGGAPSAIDVPNIVSKRVEDPFLWLLKQKKIIV